MHDEAAGRARAESRSPWSNGAVGGTRAVLRESFSVSLACLLAQSFSVCEAKIVNHAAERRLAPPSRPRGQR